MSRSGYSYDLDDNWLLIRWRGAVASALKGKKGQKLLRELADGMDAMPDKRLIANELESDGEVCALGVVGRLRGIDLEQIDPEDNETVAKILGIAHALACEVMWMNDEYVWDETPEARWLRMRQWVSDNLAKGHAEDGPPPVTSAAGFDGRAKVVGPDDRDPVGQVLR